MSCVRSLQDKDLKDYLHRMLVPPGLRPQSDADIEKTLDAFDGGPMDAESVSRIFDKAKVLWTTSAG